jgi:hypothetical protein
VPLNSRKSKTRTIAGDFCRRASVLPSSTKRARPQLKSSASSEDRGMTVGAILADGECGGEIFLEGNVSTELPVERAIGDSEAAMTKNAQHFVPPHRLTRTERYEIGPRWRLWRLVHGGHYAPLAPPGRVSSNSTA